ncbi:MAG: ferredoxin-thioredoxin reductase catalytic domain-containing protein [Methanoculleaceae archaeon]
MTEDDESALIEEMRERAEAYAKVYGYLLNPDQKKLNLVLTGLARNKARFGKPYCPCRLRSGDPEKDELIVCPCTYHKSEIKNEGHCHCNLFFSEEGVRKMTGGGR